MPERLSCGCQAIPSAWVLRYLHLLPRAARVLDVACGQGRHTALLAMKGFHVTAVDIDVSVVECLVGTPGITVECRDIENEAWPYAAGAFEAIICTNFLYRPLFERYWESLAPEGVLIYETYTEANTAINARPRNPAHLLQEGELLRLMPETARIVAYEEGATIEDKCVARIVAVKPSLATPFAYYLGDIR